MRSSGSGIGRLGARSSRQSHVSSAPSFLRSVASARGSVGETDSGDSACDGVAASAGAPGGFDERCGADGCDCDDDGDGDDGNGDGDDDEGEDDDADGDAQDVATAGRAVEREQYGCLRPPTAAHEAAAHAAAPACGGAVGIDVEVGEGAGVAVGDGVGAGVGVGVGVGAAAGVSVRAANGSGECSGAGVEGRWHVRAARLCLRHGGAGERVRNGRGDGGRRGGHDEWSGGRRSGGSGAYGGGDGGDGGGGGGAGVRCGGGGVACD
eukprot:4381896-Pleurochrysis_carterae.AAC.2